MYTWQQTYGRSIGGTRFLLWCLKIAGVALDAYRSQNVELASDHSYQSCQSGPSRSGDCHGTSTTLWVAYQKSRRSTEEQLGRKEKITPV